MEASLVIAPVVEKNRKAYVKDVLLNRNKVKNFRADLKYKNVTSKEPILIYA
jgi:hypothetical protein